jgi:hypothetical protein
MTRTRVEADREDLLAEAVNLRERIELRIPGHEEAVTIGCNDWGHWSFYFGAEPMYRFDAEGRLRRAVRGGKLYRTQGGTLAELTRVRLEQETQLQRRDLSPGEVEGFLVEVRSHLQQLHPEYTTGRCQTLREVGTQADFPARLAALLSRFAGGPIMLAPALATKRK